MVEGSRFAFNYQVGAARKRDASDKRVVVVEMIRFVVVNVKIEINTARNMSINICNGREVEVHFQISCRCHGKRYLDQHQEDEQTSNQDQQQEDEPTSNRQQDAKTRACKHENNGNIVKTRPTRSRSTSRR